MVSSIRPSEINHFKNLSSEWWDENGPLKMLHQLNPLRITYIKEKVGLFKNLRILDVGCGAGILTEPLARLGADVTGIDIVSENIEIASQHAQRAGLSIHYMTTSIEDYRQMSPGFFDVVLALEILEHVENPSLFLKNCASVLKERGHLFVSTFHRTIKSYLLGIIMAEHILKWVPQDTHHWSKFLKPSEIHNALKEKGFMFEDLKGITYDFWESQWKFSPDVSVNYMGVLRRKNI